MAALPAASRSADHLTKDDVSMTLIDILICTFRRPHIRDTVESVAAMALPDEVSIRIVVVDNDDEPSGRPYLEDLLKDPNVTLEYLHVPGRNISIARNGALDAASAKWIAFLDDDEAPAKDWLVQMWDRQQETGVDGVFGVTRSIFPPDAPKWMAELNLHAPAPNRNGNEVRDGGGGNMLLRWRGTVWERERFELSRGRTGGEDTEFCFRIGRMGAKFEIASDAIVFEHVVKSRHNFKWLARRRFRAGQTFVVSAETGLERLGLAVRACAKSLFSFLVALPFLWHPAKWRFWYLRGVFHAGVVAGCLNLSEREAYG
jgi:succinoglycan biosynthesis protein ExoM